MRVAYCSSKSADVTKKKKKSNKQQLYPLFVFLSDCILFQVLPLKTNSA